MGTTRGHEMSSRQLDHLWKYENQLCSQLLQGPQRSCSAVPSCTWGTEMEEAAFMRLKMNIRQTWIRAALMFNCFHNGPVEGFALRVDESSKDRVTLPHSRFTMLGWLVVAPSQAECPTGHRYLRSPVESKLYLGGPISMANWSQNPSVKCSALLTCKPPKQFSFFMYSTKPLVPGTEITWDYGLHNKNPNFTPREEWHLDGCCTEKLAAASLQPQVPREKIAGPARKKMCVLKAYRFCLFCGEDLEGNTKHGNGEEDAEKEQTAAPKDNPIRKNMKCHIALSHAVQLCVDRGLKVNNPDAGVTPADFLSQLYIVSEVISSLEAHKYTVIPACHIFTVLQRSVLPDTAEESDKAAFFVDFQKEAREAFPKYRVIYVRGINVPLCYDELLPVGKTN